MTVFRGWLAVTLQAVILALLTWHIVAHGQRTTVYVIEGGCDDVD